MGSYAKVRMAKGSLWILAGSLRMHVGPPRQTVVSTELSHDISRSEHLKHTDIAQLVR